MIKRFICQFCEIERDDGWHDCFHALKALIRELKPERDEALRMEAQAHARVAGLEAALRLIADAKDVRGCDEIARQALGLTAETGAER